MSCTTRVSSIPDGPSETYSLYGDDDLVAWQESMHASAFVPQMVDRYVELAEDQHVADFVAHDMVQYASKVNMDRRSHAQLTLDVLTHENEVIAFTYCNHMHYNTDWIVMESIHSANILLEEEVERREEVEHDSADD